MGHSPWRLSSTTSPKLRLSSFAKSESYSVDEQTLAWLSEHRRNFAVVACAGKYRTGKSFLLNRLAEARQDLASASATRFKRAQKASGCTRSSFRHPTQTRACSF